jgi:hypothetical protein
MIVASEESDPIPGFKESQFSRDNYILPEIIENLWDARDQAKS